VVGLVVVVVVVVVVVSSSSRDEYYLWHYRTAAAGPPYSVNILGLLILAYLLTYVIFKYLKHFSSFYRAAWNADAV